MLVHGGRDHCRNWDWVAEDLRRDYHIIAPDLRGHGDSAWSTSGDYSMNAFVYDLAQLIHQQRLAPCRIVAPLARRRDQPALRRGVSGERGQAGGDRGAWPVGGAAGRAGGARAGRADALLGGRKRASSPPASRAATPPWRMRSTACRPRTAI
ncbi:MAG: alpha/beta fold hydrolase [Caulobacteraceae bacterium]